MKLRIGAAAAVGGVLAVLLVVANAGPAKGDPVIDQWPVGRAMACGTDTKCLDLVPAARVGLDQRNPGHAPITSVTIHEEGVGADGIMTKRSGGCCAVAVFQLADGSVRAIGVGYIGVSTAPGTVDYGP